MLAVAIEDLDVFETAVGERLKAGLDGGTLAAVHLAG